MPEDTRMIAKDVLIDQILPEDIAKNRNISVDEVLASMETMIPSLTGQLKRFTYEKSENEDATIQ